MSVLPIYTYGTDVLRKKAKPVKQINDKIIKLIIDMFETMHDAQGIGLAATQVGSMHRIIVIDVSEMEEMKHIKPFVLINPVLISEDGSLVMEEGCLSIPNIREQVERAEKIRVKFKNTNFNDVEIEAEGIIARVILHELDHLNGVLFVDRLSTEQKKLHRAALKQIREGEMEVNYPVVSSSKISL
jgi:peptide deformylase